MALVYAGRLLGMGSAEEDERLRVALAPVRSEPVVRSEAPPAHVWLAFDERTPGTASGRSGA